MSKIDRLEKELEDEKSRNSLLRIFAQHGYDTDEYYDSCKKLDICEKKVNEEKFNFWNYC